MKRIHSNIFIFIMFCLFVSITSAEVLVLNLNNNEFTAGESVKVSGYVLGNDFSGQNGTEVELYFNSILNSTKTSDSSGYFEHYISNVLSGNHTIEANTSLSSQKLTFSALNNSIKPSYTIIASSLELSLSNPNLTFTVKKSLGTTLTTDFYDYDVYYQNGTLYTSSTGISNTLESVMLPSSTGLYTIVIDDKKTFTASVIQFNLKFKITDKSGNRKDVFKPNGVAYFEIEGFSSGQKIKNATVTAKVTDPQGNKKTVTFIESSGVYKGNTNVTQSTALQLRAGDYNVEFVMKDSSNNEQKIIGFFSVLGLSVNVELVDKKPYQIDNEAEFNIIIKNLADGTLIGHNSTTYFLELEKNGKFYDVSTFNKSESTDPTLTSQFTYIIPSNLEDGGYFLRVKASSSSKTGYGSEYFEIMNNEVYIDLTDNYDDFRDIFKPGELAKLNVESENNISMIYLVVENKNGIIQSTKNATINDLEGTLSFNVPNTQAEYKAEITVVLEKGELIEDVRWFSVQNYFSYMDVKKIDNTFQFVFAPGEEFLGEINVFDVTSGNSVDLSSFVIKFDKIVNEDNNKEYTNLKATKNTTAGFSDETTGRVVYNIVPPTLPNGFYRIEYTLVNTKGESFKGKGWFGISNFLVGIIVYNENGQENKIFSSGDSVNISVSLSTVKNGTATLYRDFFDEQSFSILDGEGSVLLTSAQNELPTDSGFYGFGVEVETNDGDNGLGTDFFEVKSLNFKTITVGKNGKFAQGNAITADVIIEKSGSVVNNTNVTLSRLVRARDGYEVPATLSANPVLTNNNGRTSLTITPSSNLEPGDYFVELKAKKGNDVTYNGFGFKLVQDKVIITINDADKLFSTTDNIEINVKVTNQNDTPKSNVIVNLTGLLNFQTWAPVSVSKQTTTSSNGVATLTVSGANFNPGKYAPIVNVDGVTGTIVGFGDGEFEIVPFTSTIQFLGGSETYSLSENIQVNVTVVGTVTVTAVVTDKNDNLVDVDYSYSSGILTLNNNLDPGEYFVEVTVTQSSSTKTKKLWFEVLAPWMHVDPLPNPNYQETDSIDFSYSVFTHGAQGWLSANATVNITSIENLWTGNITEVSELFNATEQSSYEYDLTPHNLPKGDYLLNFEIPTNPDFEFGLYFRIDKNVLIIVNPQVTPGSNDVTIVTNITGLTNPDIVLEGYTNYENFEYTANGSEMVSNELNSEFIISDLENGFYQAQLKITDDNNEVYYWDAFFDVRVKSVTIDAPTDAYVNDIIQFNISSPSTSTTFWLVDPFTQNVLLNQQISPATVDINYTFTKGGNFMFSFGDTMWDAWPNADFINIIQQGFSVEWPFDNNKYVLSDTRNFTFNVTSTLTNKSMTLTFKNHFTGETTTKSGFSTNSVADIETKYSFALNDDIGLVNGPHEVKLTLDDGSTEPLEEYFFIDIFSNQFQMSAWPQGWEYNSGENITINIEVYDILNNWNKTPPSDVIIDWFEDPFGTQVNPTLYWNSGDNQAKIQSSSSWTTGNYRGEINISKGSAVRKAWVDVFVKGNDNIELFWNQNKWDYSTSEEYSLNIDARDSGNAAVGVEATLVGFDKRPESWDEEPTDLIDTLDSTMYNFSNNNFTDGTGRVTFKLDIGAAGLTTGGYSGRINVGGKVVWMDFSVRSYQVDAYSEEWEYGITDTIEINVRGRNIDTWAPLSSESGNVTIKRITKHEPGIWQPTEINMSDFGVYDPMFDVSDGEALIEMLANNTALNLTKPYEFELELEMNLSASGSSEGWAWFRLSDSAKPSISIVDGTGSEPDSYFGGQTYTVEAANVDYAKLKNIWGPCGQNIETEMLDVDGTFTANLTTPNCPGWYTVETEIRRSEGFNEYIYTNFQIGGDTELNAWIDGTGNLVPEVNFTVYVSLFGEGDDPFCVANWCDEQTWFGPITNATITLKGKRDLDTFVYSAFATPMNVTTDEWPTSMIPVNCPVMDQNTCNANFDECQWDDSECKSNMQFCADIGNDQFVCEDNVENKSCMWMAEMPPSGGCTFDGSSMGGFDSSEEEDVKPGDGEFNLVPEDLGLESGKSYDLIFSYVNSDGEEFEQKVYVQVEQFHVGISKNTQNLAAKSTQYVWLKTQNLSGSPLSNCSISFDSIYSNKDYTLVKSIDISEETGSDGEMTFDYVTPSLPGTYLVTGEATCNISNIEVTQDIAYKINVGAKGLEVDMKTGYKEDENIKILITTKNRLGLSESQRLEFNFMHDRDDYPYPVYSLGGSDCTAVDANQGWEYFDKTAGTQVDNRLEIITDINGNYELELCPMPTGDYEINIFSMFDFETFEEGPKDEGPEDENGFFQYFTVGNGDVTINTDGIQYEVNDTINVTLTVYDEDGLPINGTVVAMDSYIEIESMNNYAEYLIWELEDEDQFSIINGVGSVTFDIPEEVYDEKNNKTIPTIVGPADMWVMIEGDDGNTYTKSGLLYVIVGNDVTTLSVPTSVKSDRLISVTLNTDNDARYMVENGVLFLQDNADKEKIWSIENGVFLEDQGDGTSSATIQIMSPSEPGDYYLGVPIYELGMPTDGLGYATSVMIAPIEVTLDLVNITGRITEDDATTAIVGATVRIGKKETTTDNSGDFVLSIPKGKTKVEIEIKNNNAKLTQFMKTAEYDFTVNTEVNVSFYRIALTGNLQQTLFNITSPSTDINAMRLRMNVTVNNTGVSSFTNYTIKAIAQSGEEKKSRSVGPNSRGNVLFQNLYPGFETAEYGLTIRFNTSNWNGSAYVLMNGLNINASVGALLKRTYNVETYAVSGDGLDNDGDCNLEFTPVVGCIPDESYTGQCTDEELDNNKDDDCDGKIDEDLIGETYFEWCGNGFCSTEENEAGCFIDCAQGFCGDGTCQEGEETWCIADSADCSVSLNTCNTPNECLSDGSPNFCNMWNITEPANWCQSSCSDTDCWACDTSGTSPNTQCEQVGCSLDSEGENKWCFKEEVCGDDSCFACKNSTVCGETSSCAWDVDQYSPDGGWCNRPFTCDNECQACGTQGDCETSSASWDGNNCRWIVDGFNGWCEWNATYGPPMGGMGGIIENIWLDSTNDTEDWQSIIDWKCWSGNCNSNIDADDYYIILKMGDTVVNISVNGTYFAIIYNTGGYWTEKSTPLTYTFTNGTYLIEVFDMIGPDYIAWNVTFGGGLDVLGMDPEMNITDTEAYNFTSITDEITFNMTLDDLMEAPICGGSPLDSAIAWETWAIGIDSVNDTGCEGGPCWLNEDFVVYFETNSTGGDMFPGFDYWNGTEMVENPEVFPRVDVNCTGSWISFTVNLTSINASAGDTIRTRFETWYGPEESASNIHNVLYNYTVGGD